MFKMGSHDPFEYLQHKLTQKERSGIKLAVWFPTRKSWESTLYVQVECNTSLESSQWELQLCFRPHPNQRSKQRVIVSQSCKSPNHGIFRTPLYEPRAQNHSDVGAMERHKECYMGEGGGFPQVWAMVSLVSPKSPLACLSTKSAS
jgi:hypothetical protein